MSRYLTPGKIALLCLVELYAESRFPHQSVFSILSFVLKHIVSPQDSIGIILTIDHVKEATINEPSSIPGRSIFHLLLKKLWDINSFDALHSFFSGLETYLVDTEGANKVTVVRVHGDKSPLSRTSVLGCFMRKAALEYVRLQFSEAVMLWKSFITYREPTLSLWKKRNIGAGPLSFDVNLEGLSLESRLFDHVYGKLAETKDCIVSTDDVERLLEFQVDAMQKKGTRIPDEVQRELRQMLETNVIIPSLSHYVEFLNSWRSGDYTGAFDNLHRYFDYTMQNRDRTFYQYALLNLAILQADFGCYRESVLAMQETINTARENKDLPCLNFALSWFYHFHKAHPQDCPELISSRMERESLFFLKAKAKEAGMHHLQSMAHLSEAKQILVGGESIPAAFECILRSSHLNVTKDIHNAMGSQVLLQSSVWGRLGMSHLAYINCELFLAKYTQHAPAEDIVKALCRVAYIMSMRGRYEEALERLEQVDQESLRTLKIYQFWATYIGLLKLKRSILLGDLPSADMLLEQLSASPHVEPDCELEIAITKIDLHIRRANFSQALAAINNLSEELVRDRGDIYHRIRLMNLKAQLLGKCGRPIKGLSIAVQAAAVAWKCRLLPVLFQAFCTISNILVELSEFEAAHNLLDNVTHQVVECEDAQLTGQCFATLADTQMGMAGHEEGERRNEILHKALDFLDKAAKEYAKIRDLKAQSQITAQRARILDYLEDRSLRDDAVKLYVELKQAF